MNIVNYSEKSFAVTGETKEYKEDLKKLGGKWNSNLSCGAGWIFNVKSKYEVDKFVKLKNNNESTFEFSDNDEPETNVVSLLKPSYIDKKQIVCSNLFSKFVDYLINNNSEDTNIEYICTDYILLGKSSKAYILFLKFICKTKPSLEEYLKIQVIKSF